MGVNRIRCHFWKVYEDLDIPLIQCKIKTQMSDTKHVLDS